MSREKPHLREAKAAIDGEGLAGDKVRTGGEEEHGLGYVAGGAVASHWGLGGKARGLALSG